MFELRTSTLLSIVVAVLALHALALWAVLRIPAARAVVVEVAPIFATWLPAAAPPAAPVTPPKPVVEKKPVPSVKKVVKKETPPPKTEPVPTETPALVAPENIAPESAEPTDEPATPDTATPADAANDAGRPMTVTDVRYLTPPRPVYPPRSLRLGEEGEVLIRVFINERGRADQTEIARSSGSERLDNAAITAVLNARFVPYEINGKPVPVWANVPIKFRSQ
jgi:protein TonB